MMRLPPKALSDEDRILWNKVARSARPLKGAALLQPDPQLPDKMEPPPAPPPSLATASPAGEASKASRHLDHPTKDKLAKGRLQIDGRVDLHGLRQDEAYGLLLSFLHRAHASRLRYVLVITGKGSTSKGDGVLRRAVPGWLATAAFRSVVGSYDTAARQHGGEGALYIRLRRLTADIA